MTTDAAVLSEVGLAEWLQERIVSGQDNDRLYSNAIPDIAAEIFATIQALRAEVAELKTEVRLRTEDALDASASQVHWHTRAEAAERERGILKAREEQ